MKTELIILGAIAALFLSACVEEPVAYGKIDKSPYATKECINELSRGAEIKGPQIDKIVVYKKKRRLYTYANGNQIKQVRISLGDKGGANKFFNTI